MTVRDAIARTEAIDGVTSVQLEKTETNQMLCFTVTVTDAGALNQAVQTQVESAINEGLSGDMKVSAAKDIRDGLDETDECFFWVFAYEVFGKENVGGIQYDVIEWTDERGVTAVMSDVTGGNPVSAVERFAWSEITWRPNTETLNC